MITDNKAVLKTARMLIQDIEELESIEKGFGDFITGLNKKAGNVRNAVGGAAKRGYDALTRGVTPTDEAGRQRTKPEMVGYGVDARVGDAVEGAKAAAKKGRQNLVRAGYNAAGAIDMGLDAAREAGSNAAQAVGRGAQAAGRAVGRGAQAVGRGAQAAGSAVGRGAQAVGRGAQAAGSAVGRGAQAAGSAIGRGINNAAMGALDAAEKADASAGKARRGLGGWLSGIADKVSGRKQSTSGGSAENDGWDTNLLGSKSIVSYINSRINFYENN